MTRRKFLFIHQNFPGQFVHAALELVRLGHEVVALGIKGRELPGVRFIRYEPRPKPPWPLSTPVVSVPAAASVMVSPRPALR